MPSNTQGVFGTKEIDGYIKENFNLTFKCLGFVMLGCVYFKGPGNIVRTNENPLQENSRTAIQICTKIDQ